MAKTSVFLNYVSEKMLHANTTKDGKEFVNVSIPCSKSESGYASFGVNKGQILDATKKDGTVVAGYKSVLLGKAEGTRQVSVKAGNGYENITMTNSEIAAEVEANRKAYRAAQAPAQA